MAKPTEGRITKLSKKSKEKEKRISSIGLEKALKIEDDVETLLRSPSSDSRDEKKSIFGGVIIDGRTYTCATCKAGHRVGVCKHANERPMKATHPPGRPAAGAPKKIICDCPRGCSCSKKDCKCPRNCNCTQTMFMLVYIPAPGKEDNPQDESGSWKVDKEVVTDLKGNILSPAQIEERKQQKEAMKAEQGVIRSRSTSMNSGTQPISPSRAKPITAGGCCSHKQKVVEQQQQQQMREPQQSQEVLPVTTNLHSREQIGGCNCGSVCKCEFCPQHPNNSASRNLAMQQVRHFQSQQRAQTPNNISFLPDMPHNASCMGGQPRFAMSTNPHRPSFAQLQQTFPSSGYVIAYPVWPMRNYSNATILSPMPANIASPFENLNDTGMGFVPEQVTAQGNESYLPEYDYAQDTFNIGNAFVASAGPEGWSGDILSSDGWPLSTPADLATDQFDFSTIPLTDSGHQTGRPSEHDTHLPVLPQTMLPTYHLPGSYDATLNNVDYTNLEGSQQDYPSSTYHNAQPSLDVLASFSPGATHSGYHRGV